MLLYNTFSKPLPVVSTVLDLRHGDYKVDQGIGHVSQL